MSGRRSATSHGSAPPAVDEGDSHGPLATLREQLAPTPGRLGNATRLVVLTLIMVTLGEVFRLPDTIIFVYVVFFISSNDAGSTIMTAVIGGLALTAASLATIVIFSMSLSEPALRIPLMMAITFLAGFLSRASPLGQAFYAFGFWATYNTTSGDLLGQAALQSVGVTQTSDPANANPSFIPPSGSASGGSVALDFYPPEEALVHNMLWLMLVVGISLLLVIVANRLTGRDPALILRAALADRLGAAAAFCEGAPDARGRLGRFAREGVSKLFKLHELSGRLHRANSRSAAGEQLIRELARLVLILLAWSRVAAKASGDELRPVAQTCREAERAVREGGTMRPSLPSRPEPPPDVPGPALPLFAELSRTLAAIRMTLGESPSAYASYLPGIVQQPRGLLAPDAFSNPEYVRFALKLTLAVMTCYLIERMLDWPGIHTCMITCFFVSLETVGQSVHKAWLRICGCLVGATFGIASILLLMPVMTDLGHLLILLAVVLSIAAWVKCGSERSAYAGQQIALAFFVCVLQGYGPTLDMQDARDRVIGILLGNTAVFIVFTSIWPVSVADHVRRNLSDAIDKISSLLTLQRTDGSRTFDQDEEKLRQDFAQTIAKAREVMVNDPYEPDRIRAAQGPLAIDAAVVTKIQALIIPVSVILGQRGDPAWRDGIPQQCRDTIRRHQQAVAEWLRSYGAWIRTGGGSAELAGSLPLPPVLTDFTAGADASEREAVAAHLAARAAWYDLLTDDIRSIMADIGPGGSGVVRTVTVRSGAATYA